MNKFEIDGDSLKTMNMNEGIPNVLTDHIDSDEWDMYCDINTGEYDSGKGAMIDFEIYITDPHGREFKTVGGYYYGPEGVYEFDTLEFKLI